jgi:anti-sigma factor RsiW
MRMNCDDAIERLPWLLNGTLEEEEHRQVMDHLASCERCRSALAGSRDAWRIYTAHIPTEDLVAHAWGEPTATAPELLADHLEGCPQCSAELEMVRTSRQLEEDDRVALFSPRRPAAPDASPVRTAGSAGKWRAAALAASLAGLVAIGGWFENAGRLHTAQERLAARERETVAAPAPAPAAGGGSGILLSRFAPLQDFATRSSAPEQVVTLPATLDLSNLNTFESYDLEIVDAGGQVRWKGGPLSPLDQGITLLAGSLPAGDYTLRAHGLENGQRAGGPVNLPFSVRP